MRCVHFPLISSLYLMGIILLGLSGSAAAQGPTQLDSSELKANASIVQHNPPGTPLEAMLAGASKTAASRGIEWKGLDVIRGDPPANVMGYTDTILLDLYKRYSCLADAVVIGHAGPSVPHLSSYGTTVYSDYIITADLILKDNVRSPIKVKSTIVVTRPGGTLVLGSGPVKYISQGFPNLMPGRSYLQFLRYISESRSYNAIDESATLESREGTWQIIRGALTNRTVPIDFKNGIFESSIARWLIGCN